MDSGDENLIEAKLDSIKEQVQKFKDTTELMAIQFSSDELYVEELERDVDYLQPFEVNIKKMQRLLKKDQKDAKNKNKDQDKDTKGKKPGVKLPHLKLPTFEGDPSLWNSFWDMFRCTIHDHKELDNVQKFTYLRGQFYGDALKLIEGFVVQDTNYEPALDLLKKRTVILIRLRRHIS